MHSTLLDRVKYLGKPSYTKGDVGLLKKEKPMPLRTFIGSMLTMLSLFIAFLLNFTVLGQPYYTDTSRIPFGRELLQPAVNLLALALLILGLVLVFSGLKKMESK